MSGPKYKVALRGGFADRNGIKQENRILQTDALDYRTRVKLMNLMNSFYYTVFEDKTYDAIQSFWRSILSNVYVLPVDYSGNKSYESRDLFLIINETMLTDDFACVLSLLEYFINRLGEQEGVPEDVLRDVVNDILKEECVGVRFIGRQIIPIYDENETSAVEDALKSPYEQVHRPIEKALKFFSDSDHPDYANSIKESITAVEAMCSVINGKAKNLGDALKKLEENGVVIHPALKEGFIKIYGYTSDAAGIRHSGQLGGADATFDEAKYMLVSCSAFINYLKGCLSGCQAEEEIR